MSSSARAMQLPSLKIDGSAMDGRWSLGATAPTASNAVLLGACVLVGVLGMLLTERQAGPASKVVRRLGVALVDLCSSYGITSSSQSSLVASLEQEHLSTAAALERVTAQLHASQAAVITLEAERAVRQATVERSVDSTPAADDSATIGLRSQLSTLEKDLKRTRAELSLKSAELVRKSDQISTQTAELITRDAALVAERAAGSAVEARLAATTSQLAAAQLEVDEGQRKLTEATLSLDERTERLQRVEAELKTANASLAGKNAQLIGTSEELGRSINALNATKQAEYISSRRIVEDNARLLGELKKAADRMDELKEERTTARGRIGELEHELATWRDKCATQSELAAQARSAQRTAEGKLATTEQTHAAALAEHAKYRRAADERLKQCQTDADARAEAHRQMTEARLEALRKELAVEHRGRMAKLASTHRTAIDRHLLNESRAADALRASESARERSDAVAKAQTASLMTQLNLVAELRTRAEAAEARAAELKKDDAAMIELRRRAEAAEGRVAALQKEVKNLTLEADKHLQKASQLREDLKKASSTPLSSPSKPAVPITGDVERRLQTAADRAFSYGQMYGALWTDIGRLIGVDNFGPQLLTRPGKRSITALWHPDKVGMLGDDIGRCATKMTQAVAALAEPNGLVDRTISFNTALKTSRAVFPRSQFRDFIKALRKHMVESPLGASKEGEVSLCRLALEPWRLAHPKETEFTLPLGLVLY